MIQLGRCTTFLLSLSFLLLFCVQSLKKSQSRPRRTTSDSGYKWNLPSGMQFQSDNISAVWINNWSQYRGKYSFTPYNVTDDVIKMIDIVYFAFEFFCPNEEMEAMTDTYWSDGSDARAPYCQGEANTGMPPYTSQDPFTIFNLEPADDDWFQLFSNTWKTVNPDIKIVASIGGWNFPSYYFSYMVANESTRNTFITSVANYVEYYNLDGIDIDWEYPNSSARFDPVEITPKIFKFVNDTGGNNYDGENFITLMKEMRANTVLSSKLLTICSQAGLMNVDMGFSSELTTYADFINIMTYDYTVSSTNSDFESMRTAPNQPLYSPYNASGLNIASWNVNYTINGYIERGFDPKQLLIGMALYGHTWYIPGMQNDDPDSWAQWGLVATKPNTEQASTCNNVTKFWWGGSRGPYTLQCGFYGIFEIQQAGFLDRAVYDNVTKYYFSYTETIGDDGYTPPGTWINFPGEQTIIENMNFAKNKGMAGFFVFDLSMDTYDEYTDEWTFEYFTRAHNCWNNNC